MITKDGITVAKYIHSLNSPLKTIGARSVIDASSRVNEEAGDGTTTCAVIA